MHYLPTKLVRSLQDAYAILIKGFGKAGSCASPGPGATVAGLKPASFAQKLWRFCIDPRVEESALIEPMHEAVRDEVTRRPGVLLAVHDWSTLSFGSHHAKTDRAILTHATDVGYDLATVLMVRGDDGAPIAPVVVSLEAATSVYSTCEEAHPLNMCHVDQVLGNMKYTKAQEFAPTVVHVIDREADSVNHWRQWSGDGHLAVVRGDSRKVLHQGEKTELKLIADRLRDTDSLKDTRAVLYHGRKARQYIGEAEVVLYRPGTRNVGGGNKVDVPGPPLTLRLIVSEVRDLDGKLLTRWLLLTNVPAELADAATVALWYYFRWQIESLHKLLKSSGWQLEEWLQRNGGRIMIKLLLALGACVSVWALERRDDPESIVFQKLLMNLSGRQTKRNRSITTSGLLAGLWVLQSALSAVARQGAERLNTMLENHLPLFAINRHVGTLL